MFHRVFWGIMILLSCFTYRSEAQVLNYKITHLGTQEGLSQGSVYAVLRDSRGVMWFGTQHGLNAQQGNRITSYFPDKSKRFSISGSKINSIHEDQAKRLWIGTENGLNTYDFLSNRFKAYFRNQEVSVLKILANDIYLWTSRDGFIRFNKHTNTYSRFFNDNHFDSNYTNTANSSLIVSSDEFWIHQNEAIIHVKEGKRTYYFSDRPDNIVGQKQLITKLQLQGKYLYVATENGLKILHTDTHELTHISELHEIPLGLVLDFTFDQDGAMWLCLDGNGLLYYAPKNNSYYHFKKKSNHRTGLWDNAISYVYVDQTDAVWVNTDPFGLDKIEILRGNFNHVLIDFPNYLPIEIQNQSVRSFCESESDIWVGTLNAGIWLLDKVTMEVKDSFLSNKLPSNRVFYLLRHPNGEIFAATSAGLVSIKQGVVRPIPLPTYKKKITGMLVRSLELYEDTLYISTEEGIVRYNVTKQQVASNRLFSTKKMELTYHLSQDTFFLGFISGGLWLSKKGKIKEVLRTEIPLFILPRDTTQREFWVGTNSGLFLMNARGEILKNFTTDDGLPNNFIYQGQLDDQNNLWLSTNRGISCWVSKENLFYSFNLNDGLQDYEYNAFASLKDRAGRIYFGGVNGFNYFHPDEIQFPDKSVRNVLRPETSRLVVSDFKGFLENEVSTNFTRPLVANPAFLSLFKNTTPNFLYTDCKGWVSFKVKNDTRKKWYMEVQNTRLNELEVWAFEEGREVYYQKLGDELPFYLYALRDPNPAFELNLQENQQYDIYIKARTTRDFKLPVLLWSESALLAHQNNRKMIWGVFVGFILLISCYNIFLWLTIKDKTYLYYTLYILSFGLFQFSIYGFAFQYFWSNHPVNEYAFLFFLSLAYIFITLFTESFLGLNTKLTFWKPLKRVLVGGNLIFICLLPLYYQNEFNYFSIVISLVLTILFYIICYKLWNSQDRIIRYYALAVFFLSTSSVILAFQNLGLISSDKQEYVLMAGSMCEIVLFSLALGYKFRRNLLEKERQQRIRNEISGNLHDDLAASLSSLTMYAELSKRRDPTENPELAVRFDTISQKARGILEKVRTAVYELDPRHDADEDWLYRIINFGKEIFESSEADFKAEISADFQPEKLLTGYRRDIVYLFKEAMNNAAKYAKAQTVVFSAHQTAHNIILSFHDNGIGIPENTIQTGNGISNMKARAKNCQALFEINSAVNAGTHIVVTLKTY